MTTLAADRLGSGARVVLVHGFTQTRRCWGPVAASLAADHEVVAVDAPGHGDSADVDVGFAEGAALIGDTGGAGTYVGYSMGGRYALRLALDRPASVERLVLVSASPGLPDASARAERVEADALLAARIAELGVDAFVDEWLTQPLFATLPAPMRFVDERRRNTVSGLQSSLRRAGTGAMEPLWSRLASLAMPVLVVTGALDDKFTAIGAEMARAIGPNADHVVIPRAGHTVHLEEPDAFLATLLAAPPPLSEIATEIHP